MKSNPFSQAANPQNSGSSWRRSTRVDHVTTVLLSGKDAFGNAFREYTQTAVVNLHGCKLRTSYQILVGMILNLECPKVGTMAKGVCVRVWDPPPGVAGHEIAVQLIKPQNLWGVPEPPENWEMVARNFVHGQTAPGQRPAGLASPLGQAVGVPPTQASPPVASTRRSLIAGLAIEQRLAELEGRSAQLAESVLDILRGQVEGITRDSLDEFRQQVDAIVRDAERRMRQGLQQSYEQAASSLINLRAELMGQMAAHEAQPLRSTEEAVRPQLSGQSILEERSPLPKLPEGLPDK